jgi:O-antigen ligase
MTIVKKIPAWFNHTNIDLFGLGLMLVSLPTSKYLMSIAQFILIFNWLIDPKILYKFRDFFKNKPALVVFSIFAIHVIGLLWTSDLHYAWKDLRIKLPLLALPIIISTSPRLNVKTFYYLMLVFIGANLFGSFYSSYKLFTQEIYQPRSAPFISLIRFALNISVAFFAGIYLSFQKKYFSKVFRIFLALSSIWLLFFLTLMESVTGFAIIVITSIILLTIFVINLKRIVVKSALLFFIIAIPVFMFLFMKSIYDEITPKKPFYHESLDKFTSRGNPYLHDSTLFGIENGNWVGQYINVEELESEWNKRSNIKLDSVDKYGHGLMYTLIRYMTSKGLRKDADGLNALTLEDIHNIETGIASINHLEKRNIKHRLKTVVWEIVLYRQTGYLTATSVTQRLEFWRAGINIIRENLWFGTGTGDIDNAFKQMYPKMKSQLPPDQWWRTHNQYLTVFATLGIFGFLLFIFAMVWPGIKLNMYKDYFFLVFFVISTLSMLTEDTLDTQAGVTFYAFFTMLFLLGRDTINPLIAPKSTVQQ